MHEQGRVFVYFISLLYTKCYFHESILYLLMSTVTSSQSCNLSCLWLQGQCSTVSTGAHITQKQLWSVWPAPEGRSGGSFVSTSLLSPEHLLCIRPAQNPRLLYTWLEGSFQSRCSVHALALFSWFFPFLFSSLSTSFSHLPWLSWPVPCTASSSVAYRCKLWTLWPWWGLPMDDGAPDRRSQLDRFCGRALPEGCPARRGDTGSRGQLPLSSKERRRWKEHLSGGDFPDSPGVPGRGQHLQPQLPGAAEGDHGMCAGYRVSNEPERHIRGSCFHDSALCNKLF